MGFAEMFRCDDADACLFLKTGSDAAGSRDGLDGDLPRIDPRGLVGAVLVAHHVQHDTSAVRQGNCTVPGTDGGKQFAHETASAFEKIGIEGKCLLKDVRRDVGRAYPPVS